MTQTATEVDVRARLHLIPIASIHVADDRIRREFDSDVIEDLARSIQSKGLMNPLTLRHDFAADRVILVAGETRLKAIQLLASRNQSFSCNGIEIPLGHAPYLLLKDLEPELALEAELEENTKRKQLTWQEEAAAVERLHAFRSARAREAGQSYNEIDTAKELVRARVVDSPKPVIQDILIGRFLDNPEVAKASSKSEAFARAKKLVEKQLLDAIGASVATTHKHLKLTLGDAKALITTVADETIDLILTDPPYGVSVHTAGSAIANAHHYDDSPDVLLEILKWAPEQLFRVARPMAHLYWFCDIEWFPEISLAFKDAGWKVWRVPIIWDKKGVGVVPDERRWPRRSYEAIVFATKGDMPVLKVANDVISLSPAKTQGAAEKPVELLTELISRSVTPGSHILDPFCGSGSIFLAARKAQCHCIGFEKNAEIFNVAKSRTQENEIAI